MRHHNHNRKFGREAGQRAALLRSLAVSLIDHEKIQTTEAKAKELRPYVEKLITTGKTNTVASRRLIIARLGNNLLATKKIVDTLAPKYQGRPGGYIRIVKLAPRLKDASPMAQIEFV